jgi:uncharacterized protein YciI
MKKEILKPECVSQEHLEYLNALRESGVVNMFGAGQYIQDEFGVDKKTARTILIYWMGTFEA